MKDTPAAAAGDSSLMAQQSLFTAAVAAAALCGVPLQEAADALEYGMDGGPWGLSTSGYSLIYGWLDDADTTPGDEGTDFFE